MKASEATWSALDLLREKGWCKLFSWDTEGRHCAAGALYKQLCWEESDSRSCRSTLEALGNTAVRMFPERAYLPASHPLERWERPHSTIAHINNHPDTTFEDVERIFEKTAIGLEEQGL